MIQIVVYKNSQGIYRGFKSLGHAGYDEYGHDIVCSAVSVLVINTINSIETFTEDAMRVDSDEESGMITVHFGRSVSDHTALLMDAMVLGLKTIQKEYKNKYIHLKIREV